MKQSLTKSIQPYLVFCQGQVCCTWEQAKVFIISLHLRLGRIIINQFESSYQVNTCFCFYRLSGFSTYGQVWSLGVATKYTVWAAESCKTCLVYFMKNLIHMSGSCSSAARTRDNPGCIRFMWWSISYWPVGRFCVMTFRVSSAFLRAMTVSDKLISVPRLVGMIAHILCGETRLHFPV